MFKGARHRGKKNEMFVHKSWGILYRDIVIHISEGRDVFLDIIELALVESISHRSDPTIKEGRQVQGTRAQDPRVFDAKHEWLTIPYDALAEEPAEKERRSCVFFSHVTCPTRFMLRCARGSCTVNRRQKMMPYTRKSRDAAKQGEEANNAGPYGYTQQGQCTECNVTEELQLFEVGQ